MAQMVKNLPAIQETWVQSLGWEDPMEKEMATCQYSCLENPLDRGAWRATVHRVAVRHDLATDTFHFPFLLFTPLIVGTFALYN